jgi:hypothetical protein
MDHFRGVCDDATAASKRLVGFFTAEDDVDTALDDGASPV